MKVLFAIGNDQKTKNIADRYYEKYGEVLEYKNIFYFKALIEEVKNNKTYDRIVIDEELEQYRSKDIEQLDRVLFNNIDKVTDEIQDADIILICADRRSKGDSFINKLFGIGIYNLLIGDDRNISPLCEMIRKPKTKREAKQYLNIDTSLIGDNSITIDEEINEQQMINILSFYEGIKNQPEKYLETFDRIAEQYSRTQLKIIVTYLPKAVRDVVLQADRYKYLGAQDSQNTTQPVAPRPQQQTISKPKKATGGLFSAFKKHKTEETQKTAVNVEVPSLVQPNGAIDLSSSMEESKRNELISKAKEIAEKEKAESDARAKEQAELAARAKAEAAAREQAELAAKAKAEAMAREQAELAAKAKAEAEAREQAELAAKAKAEVEAREREAKMKAEQEALMARAKAEAAAREQAELAAKAKAEEERKRQEELENKAKELAAKAKAEAEAKEQAVLAAKAKAEAEAREQAKLLEKAKADAEAREQAKLAAMARAEAEERAKKEAAAKEQTNSVNVNTNKSFLNDGGFIVEVKPNPNAPSREIKSEINVELPRREEQPIRVETNIVPPKREEQPVSVETTVHPVKPETNIQFNETPRVEINSNVPQQKIEIPQKPNEISEQERRMKEEQEKLAMEQKKIREAQEKLEEEKRKLREEQEKLLNAQNSFKASANMNSSEIVQTPRYSNNISNVQMQPVVRNFKKMVVFVGANKAGTTFVTNAIAHSLASAKIKTSILDMTRDKSMYYLYNQDDKAIRKKAAECMQRVSDGEDYYLDTMSAYLKVYTTMPGSVSDVRRSYKHKTVIETVKSNCDLTIVDADFTTPIDYFDQAEEVYIIQDLDILKMPDTTLFLRELKNRGMDMKKIKIIINKYVKTSLTPKQVVQTLSYYNDPSMSFVDEVLPNKVEHVLIPYNLNNYAKYIDSVCHGVINYKGYSTDFMEAVDTIATMIYPTKGSNTKSSKKFFG